MLLLFPADGTIANDEKALGLSYNYFKHRSFKMRDTNPKNKGKSGKQKKDKKK